MTVIFFNLGVHNDLLLSVNPNTQNPAFWAEQVSLKIMGRLSPSDLSVLSAAIHLTFARWGMVQSVSSQLYQLQIHSWSVLSISGTKMFNIYVGLCLFVGPEAQRWAPAF